MISFPNYFYSSKVICLREIFFRLPLLDLITFFFTNKSSEFFWHARSSSTLFFFQILIVSENLVRVGLSTIVSHSSRYRLTRSLSSQIIITDNTKNLRFTSIPSLSIDTTHTWISNVLDPGKNKIWLFIYVKSGKYLNLISLQISEWHMTARDILCDIFWQIYHFSIKNNQDARRQHQNFSWSPYQRKSIRVNEHKYGRIFMNIYKRQEIIDIL